MRWGRRRWRCDWPPHRGHHRPAQRRQVHAVQPHHRRARCDRERAAGRHPRPPLRPGGVGWPFHFARAEWNGQPFWLVDTGGLVPGATDALNRAIRTQIELAIAESDVLLFLVDVEQGVHPADLEIARYLRRAERPVVLVANKADRLPDDTRHLAFYELGLGNPFPVSAAVGKASGDLLDHVVAVLTTVPRD